MGAKREEEIKTPSYKKIAALITKYNKGDYLQKEDFELMVAWGKDFVEQMELEVKLKISENKMR